MIKNRIIFCLMAISIFAAALFQNFKPIITHDTFDYIKGRSIRGFIYPTFIDQIIASDVQADPHLSEQTDAMIENLKTAPTEVKNGLSNLVLWQKIVATLAVGIFFWRLSQHWSPFPLLAVSVYILWDNFFSPPLGTQLVQSVTHLLSEGLVLSYLCITLSLVVTTKRPSAFRQILFGLLCGLILHLNPRFLPFAFLAVIPCLSFQWSEFKNWLPNTIAPLACVLTILLTCTVTFFRYGAFAPTPFNGFSSFSVAIQFTSLESTVLAKQNSQDRDFITRCLRDPRYTTDTTQPFINRNVWVIGAEHYTAVYGGAPISKINNRLATLSRQLLMEDATKKRWTRWILEEFKMYLLHNKATNILCGILIILSLASLLKKASLWASLSLTLALVHVLNMTMSISLQGYLQRYAETTETLLPLSLVFLLVNLKNLMRDQPQTLHGTILTRPVYDAGKK